MWWIYLIFAVVALAIVYFGSTAQKASGCSSCPKKQTPSTT